MASIRLIDDCLRLPLPPRSVDMVFCSPPYEDARTYGIGFSVKGQDWVDWAVPRFMECLRVSRGLVAWVIEGRTRQYKWSATPALFMADLHRRGVNLRKPPIFHRVGISGSGGPDWLRNDYEFIVCGTNGGRLPWSDNTTMGKPCKYGPGGVPTHRLKNGERVVVEDYYPPKIANPGNVIVEDAEDASSVVKCVVGGGKMGSPLAHENEAPFPESLVEFFVRSFCKPGGIVLDVFSGSGTTVAVAERLGRRGMGFEVRQSQVDIGMRRLQEQSCASL